MFTSMKNTTKSILNFLAEQYDIALQRERESERGKNQSFKRRIHVTFVNGEDREAT